MSELSKTKVGARLYCRACGQSKKPVGRSEPIGPIYCDDDCDGYYKYPLPGSLWPGESEFDFGFAVGKQGVETTMRCSLNRKSFGTL